MKYFIVIVPSVVAFNGLIHAPMWFVLLSSISAGVLAALLTKAERKTKL